MARFVLKHEHGVRAGSAVEGTLMCATGRDACRLTQDLTNQLVVLAAMLARARRRVRPDGPTGRELHAIDRAFAEPIGLARKLSMAVHQDHHDRG